MSALSDRFMLTAAIAFVALLGHTSVARAQTSANTGENSQPTIETLREFNAIEAERLAAIESEVAINGPLSAELYELYFALATHYSERDDELLAAEALEQALFIQRVNYGLFAMEQVGAISRLIESSIAIGNAERAAELDIQLMRIARQNLDDVRSADILAAAADRQMEIYRRYLAGELPPVLSINIDAGPGQPPNADPNRLLGMSNLFRARRNRFDAIGVLVNAGLDTDPRIVELETSLVESYFIEANADDIRPGREEGLFRLGKASYRRLLTYAVKADDVDVAAQAMIGLADWHLLFHRNASALRLYADAYAALRQLGVSEQKLASMFNPEVPVVLPAFNPNPLMRSPSGGAERPSSKAFLNVELVMSRYGRSRLRSLSITPEPPEETVEDRIRRIVARSRFRPLLIDGKAQPTARFEFRYYYGDPGDT